MKHVLGLFLAVALAAGDTTPPETSGTLNGTLGENGWYVGGVNVSLIASDLGSGVASINYRVDPSAGEWQRVEFGETLNRLQNPSFEDGYWQTIDKWSHPYYPWWQAILFQAWEAKFGSKSAGAIIISSGTYFWENPQYYAAVDSGKIYTAEVWVRTAALFGEGASLAVFVKKSGGPDELVAESPKVSGTADWQRLAVTFSPPSGAVGAYVRLKSQGSFGNVFWDGAALFEEGETAASFVIGESGSHLVEYYSVDHAGNEETPHKSLEFKIDTSAPANWRTFSLTETENDHTFKASVTVSDSVSGLDPPTAAYQYSTDSGASWSLWQTTVTADPGTPGVNDSTLTTADIDFHDSNPRGKLVRFKIEDIAGLEGFSADQTLGDAWFKALGGDVLSLGDITASSLGPEDNAEGVVEAVGGEISSFSTTNNWLIPSYSLSPMFEKSSYDEWGEKAPNPSPLPGGRLPETSGVYFAGGDFVVDNQTIPGGLSGTPNLAMVVFVGGDLTIAKDLTVHPASSLLFIVGGDVRVAKPVERIDASFFADGNFDTSYNGGSPQKQLTVNGLVDAQSFSLRRSLTADENASAPAEIFNYPPQIVNIAPYLGEGGMSWIETR